MVRCKFKVNTVTLMEGGAAIKMTPVTKGCKENDDFFRWTPAGSFEISIVANEIAGRFVPGEEYYIDISRAKDSPDA